MGANLPIDARHVTAPWTSHSIRVTAGMSKAGPRGRRTGTESPAIRDNAPVVDMSREAFEDAVRDALDQIPPELAATMDNVVVLVEDDAPEDDPELLGLYEGVALTERDGWWAAGSLPDRITIFRNPTLAICDSVEEVVEEVAVTVIHEVAHHFGIDDDRLHELGWA
jgi:predicted Zn-dependent protease with MMP-like domain